MSASVCGEVCYACGDIAIKKDRRLLLPGSLAADAWSQIVDKVQQQRPQYQVDVSRLSSLNTVCRKCYGALERFRKLQVQLVTSAEKSLSQLSVISIQPAPITGQKHPRASDHNDAEDVPARKQSRLTDPSPSSRKQLIFAPPLAQSSPAVAVTVGYKKPKTHVLTPSRKKLGKLVANGSRASIAAQCLRDQLCRKYITAGVAKLVRLEVATMCSDRFDSILHKYSVDDLQSFNWEMVITEMKASAPTLLHILQLATRKKREDRNKQKMVIGVCLCILCKFRRPTANILQKIVSLILYAGHSSKQVFTRLHKLMLCNSHQNTIDTLDQLGGKFDRRAVEWQGSITWKVLAPTLFEQNTTATGRFDLDPSAWLSTTTGDISFQESVVVEDQSQSGDELDTDIPTVGHSPLPSSTPKKTNQLPDLPQTPLADCPVDTSKLQSPYAESPEGPLDFSLITELSSLSSPHLTKVDEEPTPETDSEPWAGFKLVGDNVDKTIKPRHMREDRQTRSAHYFHLYATKDRIDLSHIPDNSRPVNVAPPLEELLPSPADEKALMGNLSVLVSRILSNHIPFIKENLGDTVDQHIPHPHSKEMSKMSDVVPLGVILKNENRYEDMISIMEHMHQYVPSITSTERIDIPNRDELTTIDRVQQFPLLFGGDQLTVKRARGSKRIRSNSTNARDALQGLIPVCEDWHAKVILLIVIWKRLYSTASTAEIGTLFQLRNLINRRNISTEPDNNYNAHDDFLSLTVIGYVLGAAMEILGMESVNDQPHEEILPQTVWMLDKQERKLILQSLSDVVVSEYVDLSAFAQTKRTASNGVHGYAKELISLGLFYIEYSDAIREGDGLRVLRCWRYLLLLFRASNRINYTIEAFTILAQHAFLLSPRQADQLIWSRFVNTRGVPGRNIPCDLHLEHLNRLLKEAIHNLRANKTEKAIVRVGKCIGPLYHTLSQFDVEHGIKEPSEHHTTASSEKDLEHVLTELQKINPFTSMPGRYHESFQKSEMDS